LNKTWSTIEITIWNCLLPTQIPLRIYNENFKNIFKSGTRNVNFEIFLKYKEDFI